VNFVWLSSSLMRMPNPHAAAARQKPIHNKSYALTYVLGRFARGHAFKLRGIREVFRA